MPAGQQHFLQLPAIARVFAAQLSEQLCDFGGRIAVEEHNLSPSFALGCMAMTRVRSPQRYEALKWTSKPPDTIACSYEAVHLKVCSVDAEVDPDALDMDVWGFADLVIRPAVNTIRRRVTERWKFGSKLVTGDLTLPAGVQTAYRVSDHSLTVTVVQAWNPVNNSFVMRFAVQYGYTAGVQRTAPPPRRLQELTKARQECLARLAALRVAA
jgi:hypothetical protein